MRVRVRVRIRIRVRTMRPSSTMKHENWRARAVRLMVTPLAPANAWPTYACTKRSPG